jgi:hypothetical protein
MSKKKYLLYLSIIVISSSFMFFFCGYFLSKKLLHIEKLKLEGHKKREVSVDINKNVPSQLEISNLTTSNEYVKNFSDILKGFLKEQKIKRTPSDSVQQKKIEMLQPYEKQSPRKKEVEYTLLPND